MIATSSVLPVAEGYDRWAPTYDRVANATRDAAAAKVQEWSPHLIDKHVLELGCGTGGNTQHIARVAASTTALDFSIGMLSAAKNRPECRDVCFLRADVTTGIPIRDGAFDVVLESLVLEHVEHLRSLFREAYRVLRPGGLFLGSELHPFRQLAGKQARFVPPGSTEEVLIAAHTHTTSDFVNAAVGAGFHVVRLDEDADLAGPRLFSFWLAKP
jgi:ubiquinone/menaquinone biosynthesis C-methylase UbiE